MATVPTVPSFTSGRALRAVDLNNMRDGINFLTTGMPHAFARQSQHVTTISNVTWTQIDFDTVEIDSDSSMDSSGTYTCHTPGTYIVGGNVCWDNPTNSTSGDRGVRLMVNGLATVGASIIPAAVTIVTGHFLVRNIALSYGDQLTLQAFQNTGSDQKTILNYANGRSEVSFFDVMMVSA